MPKKKKTETKSAADTADVQVTGAGSPLCNGVYTNVNFGDHYDGPGGLQIQFVADYPAPGDLVYAIVDSSSRIYYVGPDVNTFLYPWDAPWTVGSFGTDPAPTVAQATDAADLSDHQMSSTVTHPCATDDYMRMKVDST